MNDNYAKFQKRLIVEQFQGYFFKIKFRLSSNQDFIIYEGDSNF